MVQIPVTELARRFCVASHRADLRPEPRNVPCGEHRRYAQLYYGLIDPNYKILLDTIQVVADEEAARNG